MLYPRDERRKLLYGVAHLGRIPDAARYRLEEGKQPQTWKGYVDWLHDDHHKAIKHGRAWSSRIANMRR